MQALLLASCIVLAAPPVAPRATEVRDLAPLLEPIRAKHDLPGLAALILTSDGTVAEGYVGLRERGAEGALARTDRFHLGSCTKAMTATLIARYVEDGKLAWDTTVAAIYPDLAGSMHESWRDVTLDQLLSHTAGAPGDLRAFQPLALAVTANAEPLARLRRLVVRELTAAAPAFEPGTSYGYSNWGYVIAAAMLEARTNKSWEELIRVRLFEPLGMKRCGFGPPREKRDPAERRAPAADDGDEDAEEDDEEPEELEPLHADNPCGHTPKGEPRPGADNPATIGPAGTVHGPLGDWARFVQLHLLGARGVPGLLLEPASFEHLHEPRPGTNGTYAEGWLTLERPWSTGGVLAHNGSNTLWMAWVWIAPAEDFAVLVVTNQGGPAAEQGADTAAGALITAHLARLAEERAADENK